MGTHKNIILYDGVCILCNRFVRIILNADKDEIFSFCSLQSDYAEQLLDNFTTSPSNRDTVILFRNGQLYDRSTAVLKIVTALPGLWKLGYVFYIIPGALRDLIYDWVAKNRYKIFGKSDTCMLVPAEYRKRIVQ